MDEQKLKALAEFEKSARQQRLETEDAQMKAEIESSRKQAQAKNLAEDQLKIFKDTVVLLVNHLIENNQAPFDQPIVDQFGISIFYRPRNRCSAQIGSNRVNAPYLTLRQQVGTFSSTGTFDYLGDDNEACWKLRNSGVHNVKETWATGELAEALVRGAIEGGVLFP